MRNIAARAVEQLLALTVATVLLGACADDAPLAPSAQPTVSTQSAVTEQETNDVIVTLKRVTVRYQNVNVAIKDGFVLLHPCENRPGEGPVGTVYVHIGRLLDGEIKPELPDALIYAPRANGTLQLAGAEFAVPYPLWPGQQPPTFMGATFQNEDEFGVYALHAWVWLSNPAGLFAEVNPRISCGGE